MKAAVQGIYMCNAFFLYFGLIDQSRLTSRLTVFHSNSYISVLVNGCKTDLTLLLTICYMDLYEWHKTSGFRGFTEEPPSLYMYLYMYNVYCSTHAPGDLERTIFLEDQCFPLHPFNIKGGGLVDFDELRASWHINSSDQNFLWSRY